MTLDLRLPKIGENFFLPKKKEIRAQTKITRKLLAEIVRMTIVNERSIDRVRFEFH